MVKTRPRRRRFLQFSLRTVLVLITVVAVWLGTWLDRGRREKAAVEALRQSGYVTFDCDFQWDANGEFARTAKPPGPEWAREWLGRHCFMRVVGVTTTYGEFDDDALAPVAQFRQLRRFANDVEMVLSHLEGRGDWSTPCNYAMRDAGKYRPISDAGLTHLSRLAHLESLVLIGTEVTDEGLRQLTGLQRLKRLKISSPNITDEGVPLFLKLEGLEDLCISGTSVSGTGIAELRRGLPNCTVVGPEDARRGFYSPK